MNRKQGFVQRTKDGYFNATKLIELWNNNNEGNKKILGNYNSLKTTKEFIKKLHNEGIEKPLKTGRGKGENVGTWMNGYLFIDFAMWVSVEFKFLAIKYLKDGLIFNRNEAGDYYNEMCASILKTYVDYYGNKPPPSIYISEARLIKSLVTEKPRNEMTEQELKQITYLQKVNANLLSKNIGKTKRMKRLIEASEINI